VVLVIEVLDVVDLFGVGLVVDVVVEGVVGVCWVGY